MHSLKYARVIHPYEMLLKYWRSELPFLGLWGLVLLRKGSSSQVEVWKYPLAKIGAKDESSHITASSTAKHI